MNIAPSTSILAYEDNPLSELVRHGFVKTSAGWQQSKAVDVLITETPLQISLKWQDAAGHEHEQQLMLTMRTPGNDSALCMGLLYAEGVIASANDIVAITLQQQDDSDVLAANDCLVELKPTIIPRPQLFERPFTSTASCGVCGKTAMQGIELSHRNQLDTEAAWLSADTIVALTEKLNAAQTLFKQTGAVHGAAIFTADGELLTCQEDVGRHNAVDKAIGQLLIKQRLPAKQAILVVSGRVSFELIQKCVMANIPVMVAVGAPSSLAVAMAQRFNITLVGFNRQHQFNLYHGHWRIKSSHA